MKKYELIINEDDKELEVNYMSVVDSPAIQENFLVFNKENQRFAEVNKDKRILRGAAMIPDLPIYRVNKELGEHYVFFSAETIRKIVYKFMRQGFTSNTNINHKQNSKAEGLFIFESLIIDRETGMNPPQGFDEYPDGTWLISMFCKNDEIYDKALKGELNGFSVEGYFEYLFAAQKPTDDEVLLYQIYNLIKNI